MGSAKWFLKLQTFKIVIEQIMHELIYQNNLTINMNGLEYQ